MGLNTGEQIHQYSTLKSVLEDKKGKKDDGHYFYVIQMPLCGNDNNRIINILIDGFMLSIYLDSRSLSFEEKYPFIKEDGSMVIIGRIILNDPFLFKILIKSYAFLKHKLN